MTHRAAFPHLSICDHLCLFCICLVNTTIELIKGVQKRHFGEHHLPPKSKVKVTGEPTHWARDTTEILDGKRANGPMAFCVGTMEIELGKLYPAGSIPK